MFKHMEKVILANVRKWGNSAGVLLSRELEGKQVKVILIDRTMEIKKEIFDILKDYLEDTIGIYLVGSYARDEQQEDSDIDILVISDKIKKEFSSGRYNISIYPLNDIKKAIEKNPVMIMPRILEAKTIINPLVLEELKKIKLKKECFNKFFSETKKIIGINKEMIKNEEDVPVEVIYSLMLRLRGIFIIKSIIKQKIYSNEDFMTFLKRELPNYHELYVSYQDYRDNKKTNIKIKSEVVLRLVRLIEKEVR